VKHAKKFSPTNIKLQSAMEGAQNGTIAFASEQWMNNMR